MEKFLEGFATARGQCSTGSSASELWWSRHFRCQEVGYHKKWVRKGRGELLRWSRILEAIIVASLLPLLDCCSAVADKGGGFAEGGRRDKPKPQPCSAIPTRRTPCQRDGSSRLAVAARNPLRVLPPQDEMTNPASSHGPLLLTAHEHTTNLWSQPSLFLPSHSPEFCSGKCSSFWIHNQAYQKKKESIIKNN